MINQLSSGILSAFDYYHYRTKDGKAVFTFSYHKVQSFSDNKNYFEIDIHKMPSFNGRNDSSVVAHWLPCSRPAGKKICMTVGKEPKTLEKAKKVSTEYAELLWTYIRTGITIDNQLIRRN